MNRLFKPDSDYGGFAVLQKSFYGSGKGIRCNIKRFYYFLL